MTHIKITSKEIKRGLDNHTIPSELLTIMPYNREEVCVYTKEIASSKSIFNKYKLNIVSNYPAKLNKRNTYYTITDNKNEVVWKSDKFKLTSYYSEQYLNLGLKILKKVKGEDLEYEVCDR